MEDLVTLTEAGKKAGILKTHLQQIIFDNDIHLLNGKLKKSDLNIILSERRSYISLYEYAVSRSSSLFDGKKADCRNNLYEFLLRNSFLGLDIIAPQNLLIGSKRDVVFFHRSSIATLDEKTLPFIKNYGLSEKDLIAQIINDALGHKTTIKHLQKFLDVYLASHSATKATTDFVRKVLSLPDVSELRNSHIEKTLRTIAVSKTLNLIVEFLNYVRLHEAVSYSVIYIKQPRKSQNSLSAYTNEEYIALAKCFFNKDHIERHDMIRKSLENHNYAEMWLYLCLFFVCGWRAKDVTRNWQYPELYKHERVIPGINPETLFNDILSKQIAEESYRTVCLSAIVRIDLANVFASKTIEYSHQPLSVLIPPELQVFFGQLTLIGECHRLRSKNGYMDENRIETYQNKMKLRAFFGQTIYEILHGENISSLRLNKDFLQGVQQAGRKKGLNGIQTAMLAAYARNHTGLGSISHYLQDGNLSQETAEMVLYCMMERGVFGFQIYRTLLTAYPESMSSLSTKKQTEIINMLKSSPLKIETEHSGLVAKYGLETAFKAGDTAEALRLLQNMLTISQQRGSGKDYGVYCLKRAGGEACIHPEYESCFVCCCEDLVFTRYGLLPLIDVLNDFYVKAETGDKKAEGILIDVLIPHFQNVINQLIAISALSKEERKGIKRLIERKLLTKS